MQDKQKTEKYNEDFDKLLKEAKVITKELFEKLYDAYSYDTATTHSWLVKKIKILKERLEKDETLLDETNNIVLSKNNFLDWIELEFKNIKKDLI